MTAYGLSGGYHVLESRSTISTPFDVDITRIAGPPLLGIMFNWFLFGILTVQIFAYQTWFPREPKPIKALVYSVFILETVQTSLVSYDGWQWYAKGWGDWSVLERPFTSPVNSPIFDALVSASVQGFFAWRLWILARSRLLTLAIAAMSLTQAIAGIVSGSLSLSLNSFPKIRTMRTGLGIWLGGAALTDTVIAFSMTLCLQRARKTSGDHSRFVIRRVMRLVIETNTLTALVALAGLVVFIAFPKDNIFVVPPYVLGKLYSNTLLVVLNNRVIMRDIQSTHTHSHQLTLTRAHSRNNHKRPFPASAGVEPYFTTDFLDDWSESESPSKSYANAHSSRADDLSFSAPRDVNQRSLQRHLDHDVESAVDSTAHLLHTPSERPTRRPYSDMPAAMARDPNDSNSVPASPFSAATPGLLFPRALRSRPHTLYSSDTTPICHCGMRREQNALSSALKDTGDQIGSTALRGSDS